MGAEILILFVALLLFLLAWTAFITKRPRQQQQQQLLPPGPRPWPVVGNIFDLLLTSRRQSFSQLAAKYGHVITIHLGVTTTVVISSASAAREMFKSHDAALSGRSIYESMKLKYGSEGSVITAQPGPHWRLLRRLYASQFSAASLDSSVGVRQRCLDSLVRSVDREGGHGTRPVDVGRLFFSMAFDHIGHVALSEDLSAGSGSEEGCEFFYLAQKIMDLAGKPNVADFVPALRWIDPQGVRRKMNLYVGKALEIVSGFVERRTSTRRRSDERMKKDFLDMLLEFEGRRAEEPATLSGKTINNMILEMFMAGTDTTRSTLEWVMTELLRHPPVMLKLQAELRTMSTRTNNQMLGEKDVSNLTYLNAVIKETLRLHPPLPFLVPHKATKDCTMLGYHIPESAQIFVNVWELGKDSRSWIDPTAFKPERFLEEACELDWKGHHFEFIPFGSGRRMCPAVSLMSRMMPLVIGTMVLSFDWVLPDGETPETVDMGERMGISLRKAVPLKAIAVPLNFHQRPNANSSLLANKGTSEFEI